MKMENKNRDIKKKNEPETGMVFPQFLSLHPAKYFKYFTTLDAMIFDKARGLPISRVSNILNNSD